MTFSQSMSVRFVSGCTVTAASMRKVCASSVPIKRIGGVREILTFYQTLERVFFIGGESKNFTGVPDFFIP